MEFVSNIPDIMKVVGEVGLLPSGRGIQMELPESLDGNISRIVFGLTQSGKWYIETVSDKEGHRPIYGEASIPEIFVFATKAIQEMPNSEYAQKLITIASQIEDVLNSIK